MTKFKLYFIVNKYVIVTGHISTNTSMCSHHPSSRSVNIYDPTVMQVNKQQAQSDTGHTLFVY